MATIRLVPSTHAVNSTTYLSVTNPSNAYANTDSTNYATITNINASTYSRYYYLRGFNFSNIPANATINSFTIKIKGYESGLSTSTSYAPRLATGSTALKNTTAKSNFGTSVSTITIPTGELTWEQIVSYGSTFTIMVCVRRANKNTTGYFYCYGAEIEVNYTLPGNKVFIKSDGQWKEAQHIYVKNNNVWSDINTVYKKVNGTWESQSDKSTLFDQNALFLSYDVFINTPHYGVSEFRVDKTDLTALLEQEDMTFQDYLEDLNNYSTARCIPDKYIKVGELTIDGTTYYRYDGYVNNNTRHTESVGGNTYYVGMLVPSTFQFKRVNTIKYIASMPSQSINGYIILTDSNDTIYHTVSGSSLNMYSVFGDDYYYRVLVDFTV